MGKDFKSLFSDKGFIFKLVVLILCIVGVILWAACTIKYASLGGLGETGRYWALMLHCTGGYLIIMALLIFIYIFDDTDALFEKIFLFVGFVLNLVAGLMCLIIAIKYDANWVLLALSGIMIASGIIMLIDFIKVVRQ